MTTQLTFIGLDTTVPVSTSPLSHWNMELPDFILSLSANWDPKVKEDAKKPQMLKRSLSGFIHPMICVGHASEFGSPGMLAKGA